MSQESHTMLQSQVSTRLAREDERVQGSLILVIEDHAATRKVLSCLLELQGYRPICLANGQEALEWMESAFRMKQYPVAILLDLLMPVMDGATFLQCLRAQWRTLVPLPPVILLTADYGNHDYLACTDVLLKPFHIGDLLARLRRALSQQRRGNYLGLVYDEKEEARS
jgi:CheY-like chemotaxis protein